MAETVVCSYFPRCNACDHWGISYTKQSQDKIENLKKLFIDNNLLYEKEIEFISCGKHSLRHRIDFTFEFNESTNQTEYGFYSKAGELVSISTCLQLSPELQTVFKEFLTFNLKAGERFLKKGSVRLRISPNLEKGCWLDLANIDIKDLLDDGVLLRQLMKAGFKVELGQKGKSVIEDSSRLKLSSPSPSVWFKSLGFDGKDIAISSQISDFTQPSWITAQKLNEVVFNWIKATSKTTMSNEIIEFGAGIGQFTISLLSAGYVVHALELEEAACECLNLNASLAGYADNLKIHLGDFHRKIFSIQEPFFAFLNPARSGLKGFTDSILTSNAEFIIYISCFPESMCLDLQKFTTSYEIIDAKIVDQFPQAKHFETCVLLRKLS